MLPISNVNQNKNNKLVQENKKERTILSEVISDYLSNSTIHGISYLGAKDKNLIEKTWWIIGLVLSASACTYFINKTWTKWKQNPVIVSFAQEHTSIWEIPFPAVTVCPLNKIKQTEFNYTAFFISKNRNETDPFWNSSSAEDRRKYWDISFVCNPYSYFSDDDADNITDEMTISNIKLVSFSLAESMYFPVWNGEFKSSFADQITSEGLCFTFNGLGHYDMYTDQMKEGFRIIDGDNTTSTDTDWTMENGYSTTDEESSYPLRSSQAGLSYGLEFQLTNPVFERTKYCGEDVSGYKMMLHNPAEIPRIGESYSLVPANQKVIVAINPKVMRTSKNLVDIPPHTRNCYFSHEKKLRFFKIYTEYNCKTECLSNITRVHCGCVPFYLPPNIAVKKVNSELQCTQLKKGDNDTEICGFGNMLCVLHAKELKYLSMVRRNKIDIDENEKEEFETFQQCDCLVSCDYIDYEFDLSQADFIYDELYLTEPEDKEYKFDSTPINIFFKDSAFIALERNELYGQTDFIANIGGLLGLCMGFSFLSFLEIVYFITLRVWCKIYHKNKNNISCINNSKSKIVWLD